MTERPDAASPQEDNHHPSHDFHSSNESDGVCTECGADCDTDKARQPCAPPPSDAAQQFIFHARTALGIWLDGDGKKKVFEEAMEALDDASVKLEKSAPSDAAPVAWTWTTVDRVTGKRRRHTSFDRPYPDAYTKDVRPLVYAHPEDAPGGPPLKEVGNLLLGNAYHMTPTSKTKEMTRWEESKVGPRGKGGHGYPDDLIIPLCDEINSLPHVCTLQSCAGHKARENECEYPGNLWLWFTRLAFGRFLVCADAVAFASGIKDVRILYRRYNDARFVVEIAFDGYNKSAEAFGRSAETILRLVRDTKGG